MQLQVTLFRPESPDHREDPVYRFSVVETGEQIAFLFTVPVSQMRTASNRSDLRQVTVNRLNEADFHPDDISSVVEQLEAAGK